MKYLLAISTAALLLSSSAIAQEWSKDELASGVRKVEYTRRVPAEKPRVLEDVTYLNADCSVSEDTEMTITKEPEHGSATIEKGERYPAYPKDNVRAKCNDRKVKNQKLVYKPAVNFTGDDTFEVQVLSPNGQVVEYSYHVKVVGPSKGGRADIRP